MRHLIGKNIKALFFCARFWGNLEVFTKWTTTTTTKKRKKNSRVTYISGGRSRPTLDQKFTTHPRLSVKFTAHHTLVLVLNTWRVDEGRPSYSQRTSKSGESHAINNKSRCSIRKEKRPSFRIIKYAQSRGCNILSLQLSQSNYAKCNQP